MRYTVTGSQMKQIDQDTIKRIGIPSVVLMERAALAAAEAAEELLAGQPRDAGVLVACGTGNNGADGIAVGRILHGRGYRVKVLLAGNLSRATEEHRMQQQIAEKLQVPVMGVEKWLHPCPPGTDESRRAEAADAQCQSTGSERYGVIVDAVFGIGLGRPVEGSYRELLERLAGMEDAKVVAVDIPSGIHADTGAVMGIALPADITVTFGYGKSGLMLYPGRSYAGQVRIADIGFSEVSRERAGWDAQVLEAEDRRKLPERQADGNKGTFGKVLVVAGSRGMCGAAYLSALAAYRTGAGLVKVLTVPDNRAVLQAQLPEAIVETYDPDEVLGEGVFSQFLERQCDWADAIVLGPGLGREPYVETLVELVLSHAYVPMVLDADGLNAVADHPHLTRYFTENIIITPHMGEMARLTGMAVVELKADPLRGARDYSSHYGVVCVLKDAATVIADKEGTAWINGSGCSAMAKAGSGDVLTGVIAGLLARGMEGAEAAAYGVLLHGLAGEAAAGKLGNDHLLARELADALAAERV